MPYDQDGKYVKGSLSFEPKDCLIKVKGSKVPDYLEVKYRLVMLREQFPESTITTDLIYHDLESRTAIVQTCITLPTGAVGMGIKMEEAKHFPDYVEKAETGSVGRALYAVGIGLQYSNVDYDYEADSIKDFTGVDGPVTKVMPKNKIMTRENIMEQLADAAERLTPEVLQKKSMDLFNTSQSSKLSSDQLKELLDWASSN